MTDENVKAQMRKGILDYCILAILSRGESYAPKIISELKRAQMIVVEGTLYPILTRQKNLGLLTYHWEESPQGPPRKYYTLTERGREYLKDMDEAWIEMVNQIHAVRYGAAAAETPAAAAESPATTAAADAATETVAASEPEIPETAGTTAENQ